VQIFVERFNLGIDGVDLRLRWGMPDIGGKAGGGKQNDDGKNRFHGAPEEKEGL